jgi:hypothetical protein
MFCRLTAVLAFGCVTATAAEPKPVSEFTTTDPKKMSQEEPECIKIEPNKFRGEWNYKIIPAK